MNSPFIPVILAGGAGTRLWPLSRSGYPKQFLPIASNQTMLQETLKRTWGLDSKETIIVCNEEHRFIVSEQIRTLGSKNSRVLLEPEAKNTAPAIALAAFDVVSRLGDGILFIMASDHVIEDLAAFEQAASVARQVAEDNFLVTFGVVPTGPETGYGYLQQGESLNDHAWAVQAFVEKPDVATAVSYVESGLYSWNSGMFMFKASVFLEQLQRLEPSMYSAAKLAIEKSAPDLDFVRPDAEAFATSPANSIDYAIMEKAPNAMMVKLDAGWSDVGSWSSLWELAANKNEQHNACFGDVVLHNTQGCLITSTHRLVATIGLKDLVIIETKDAVLVADKNSSQDVKEIVSKLKSKGRKEAVLHRQVDRPWGHYDSIDEGERYQVKRITVKPGAKLSVQMHHHRAEHWIVVSGTAKVTIGDEDKLVTENESVYIPVGAVHALENPGKLDLELIEVQSGAYLGEDDIVRFVDNYGRV